MENADLKMPQSEQNVHPPRPALKAVEDLPVRTEQTESQEGNNLPLEVLEKEGLVQIEREGNKEYTVVDIERLKCLDKATMEAIQRENGVPNRFTLLSKIPMENRDILENFYRQKGKNTEHNKVFFEQTKSTKNELLIAALGQSDIVSKEDWERGVREEKPLFYMPQTKEDAFNPTKILQSKFHIGPWEMTRSVGDNYPFAKEEIPYTEARMACTIFHPEYGAGFRDTEGHLMVTKKGEAESKPISYTFFESFGLGQQSLNGISSNAAEIIPNLVGRHILAQNDFQVLSERGGQSRRVEKNIPENGQFMIDSKRYALKGEEFSGKEVQKVNDSLAVILETSTDRTVPTHIFFLENEPKEGTDYISKSDMELHEFSPADFFPQRADESENAYKLRLKELTENFVYGLDLAEKLSKTIGEKDIYQFDINEICALASVARNFRKSGKTEKKQEESLMEFAKEFGREGLSALLSVDYDMDIGDKIIELGGKNPEICKRVFHQYKTVLRQSELIEKGLKNQDMFAELLLSGEEKELIDSLPGEISEAIKRRAKDMFLAMDMIADSPKQEYKGMNLHNAELAMRAFNHSLLLINSLIINQDNHEYTAISKQKSPDGNESSYVFDNTKKDSGENDKVSVFIRKIATDHQARISFMITPSNEEIRKGFTQTVNHKGGSGKVENKIRIAFDLDVDSKGNTRGVSMDTGRSPYSSEKHAREGDVLGKILEIASEHKSHNYGSFDPRLSEPQVFSKIAGFFDNFFESQYTKIKSSSSSK